MMGEHFCDGMHQLHVTIVCWVGDYLTNCGGITNNDRSTKLRHHIFFSSNYSYEGLFFSACQTRMWVWCVFFAPRAIFLRWCKPLLQWGYQRFQHAIQLINTYLIQPTFYLTHCGSDKMAANSQTTFSRAFSWMKKCEFCLRFHWNLFQRFELTIFQHWFR